MCAQLCSKLDKRYHKTPTWDPPAFIGRLLLTAIISRALVVLVDFFDFRTNRHVKVGTHVIWWLHSSRWVVKTSCARWPATTSRHTNHGTANNILMRSDYDCPSALPFTIHMQYVYGALSPTHNQLARTSDPWRIVRSTSCSSALHAMSTLLGTSSIPTRCQDAPGPQCLPSIQVSMPHRQWGKWSYWCGHQLIRGATTTD